MRRNLLGLLLFLKCFSGGDITHYMDYNMPSLMEIPQKKRERTRVRITCNFDVVINDSLTCKAFDIDEGGLYIMTDSKFTVGSVVKLSLPFRDERLELSARIKYCIEGLGMGLMFIDMNDVLKGKIRTLLEDVRNPAC